MLAEMTDELRKLIREHDKRWPGMFGTFECPGDPEYVAKRLRQALEEGKPYDTFKEFYEGLSEENRRAFDRGELLL